MLNSLKRNSFRLFPAFHSKNTRSLFSVIQAESLNISICPEGEQIPPAITCSKLIIETLEQGVKYVQSLKTPE